MDPRLRAAFAHWRDDLISLDKRNRLLYYRPYRSSTVEIMDPGADAVVQPLLQGAWGWDFFYPPDPSIPPERRPVRRANELATDRTEADALRKSLQRIDRRAQQAFIDTGIWLLYLGVGMLSWREPDETEDAHSPILLIPTRLDRVSPRDPYRLVRADAEVVVNPALAVKLETDWGIALPNLADVDELTLESVLSAVARAVDSWPEWKVSNRVVLSTFSFHKMAMYQDLLANEETILEHAAIQALALGPDSKVSFAFPEIHEDQIDREIPPEDMVSILDADSSQRRAIKAAIDGHSFVMDGPPGTGKSQTIANMITELMYRGKTVLFVSEKAAALEVVHSRLAAKGLDAYLLPLHSDRATRKEVAAELGRALAIQPAGQDGLTESEIERARERRLELSGYAQAINELRSPLGRTLQYAFGRLAQLQSLPRMPFWEGDGKRVRVSDFERILDSARGLSRAWGPVLRGSDFVWRHLAAKRYDLALKNAIEAEVEEAQTALRGLAGAVEKVATDLGLDLTQDESGAERLLAIFELLAAGPSGVPNHWLSHPRPGAVRDRISRLERDWMEVIKQRDELQAAAGPRYRDLRPGDSARLERAQEALTRLPVALQIPADWGAGRLTAAVEFSRSGAARMTELRPDVNRLASDFGIPSGSVSANRAQGLARLAIEVAARDLPEPTWLSPITLPAVKEAAAVLGDLVDQYKDRRAKLSEVFNETVLDLDLVGITLRFEQVHKGPLKFLRSGYRADKRAVAGATRLGRADARAVGALRDALEWQRLRSRLDETEGRHAAALGSHYYSRDKTDFEAVAAAIEVAALALSTAGRDLDSDAMARRIARGAVPDASVHQRGLDLLPKLEELLDGARQVLADAANAVLEAPLAHATVTLDKAASDLDELRTVVQAADAAVGSALDLGKTASLLKVRAQLSAREASLQQTSRDDGELLGAGYRGARTDWAQLRQALKWASRVVEKTGPVSSEVATKLLSTSLGPADIASDFQKQQRTASALLGRFQKPWRDNLADGIRSNFSTGLGLLELLGTTTPDIEEWIAFADHRETLTKAGFDRIVAAFEERLVAPATIPLFIERALYEGWVDAMLATDDRLKHLRAVDRDERVSEFRTLDEQLVKGAFGRVINACNARRPRSATLGEAGIIAREAAKKRRHMPVRKLLAETSQVTLALKPCFMMSPLTVSQFLAPEFRFDAVIFDEASQVKPADAINAVYRGRQLIVAGDQKQLPPSNFFEATTASDGDSDEYEEGEVPNFESVLDLCKGSAAFPSVPLLWHYRSQHEALIAYSNKSFYDGRLFTFPGAVHVAPDLGLQLYRVPGIYRRSTSRDNPEEAAKVAERVLYHAINHPTLTLGVVTFSEAQQEAVDDAVWRARAQRPDLDEYFKSDRLNGFFVKNLETVQGDERDIIIFSVGYGKDEGGKFRLNLGPLTRAGGERRLNVAITRARRRIELVASVSPADFTGEMSKGGGVWHLSRYLEYVEHGGNIAMLPDETNRDFDSPLEADVAATVKSWGYDVVPQVGAASFRIDIGVRLADRPGRFILGIECDGAMYHASRVARDRDRIRAEMLQGLAWRLHRVWSPAWYRDRAHEESRLKAAVDAAAATPVEIAERRDEAVGSTTDRFEYEEVELGAEAPWTAEYKVASPKAPRYRVDMHLPESGLDMRRMVGEVVEVEAPVHSEVVLRRIREAWGVYLAGDRIWSRFVEELQALKRAGQIEMRGEFIWRPGRELTHVRVPSLDPETARRVAEVPPEEIDLAVAHLAADAIGASRDDITENAARMLGWQRRGVDIKAALDESLGRLVAAKQVEERGGRFYWTGGDLPNHGTRTVARKFRLEPPPPPPQPGGRAFSGGVRPGRQREVQGDPSSGVRARPSKDHPGQFYAVERDSNRRVLSGYFDSVGEIERECRERGWPFLGGSRKDQRTTAPIVPVPFAPSVSADGRPIVPADIQHCLTTRGHNQLTEQLDQLLLERESLERNRPSDDATGQAERLSLPVSMAALDNKIREIQRIFEDCRIVAHPAAIEYAVLGSIVAIKENGGPEEVYQLVGPLEADPENSRINATSPLGSALYGRRVGEEVEVQPPNGGTYSVVIVDIASP